MPTLPGYSKVIVARTGEAQEWGNEAAAAAAGVRVAKGLSSTRGHLSRLSALADDASSPRSAAARDALSAAVNSYSTIGKQLALIEMLMALGAAREPGSLESALDQLAEMESELGNGVSRLLARCGVTESIA